MTWPQASVLGLVQGLTELLPISSSAHLRIVGPGSCCDWDVGLSLLGSMSGRDAQASMRIQAASAAALSAVSARARPISCTTRGSVTW